MSVDPLLVQTAQRLFADVATFEAVEAAEAIGWSGPVWQPLADAGFPWIGLPESANGSGGTLADACAVLRAAGARGAPVPLAETGILAGWLLASSGGSLPDGPLSVAAAAGHDGDHDGSAAPASTASIGADGRVTGQLQRVPWGRSVARVVVLIAGHGGDRVAAIDPAAEGVTVEPATNLAGEPRDTLHLDGVIPDQLVDAGPGVDARALRLRGALSRAQLMAGALSAMSELTVAYTNDRQQFGQPVARFQAVQAHLVHGAQDAALALVAAEVAARQADRAAGAGDIDRAWVEIANARVVAGEASVSATRAAHQAHGAMGMTREYPLHHLSRRLWAWSREWGPTSSWRAEVGAAAHRAGADRLYPLITDGTSALHPTT